MRSFSNILHIVRNFLFSRLNKEFLIFLFFFALSGIYWLMMTLNETTEREYDIPVQLTGVPRNAVITGDIPDTVHITVRDKGFTLVAYTFSGNLRPITVRFGTYADDATGHGVVPVADVQKQVQAQLYGSSKLLSVKPGNFDFYFTYGASKKVPVVFRGRITTRKSYYLAHTEFLPSTVTVYASKQQLDQLKSVEIEPFNMRNLQDTIHRNVCIKKIRGMKVVPQMVRLAVYPDVLTEEAIEVPVTAINMPPNMVLRTFPSRVAVRFTVGASLFRTIKENQFCVVVDYNELSANSSDKCQLQLRSVPRSVSKARLDIDEVDYLLEQQ